MELTCGLKWLMQPTAAAVAFMYVHVLYKAGLLSSIYSLSTLHLASSVDMLLLQSCSNVDFGPIWGPFPSLFPLCELPWRWASWRWDVGIALNVRRLIVSHLTCSSRAASVRGMFSLIHPAENNDCPNSLTAKCGFVWESSTETKCWISLVAVKEGDEQSTCVLERERERFERADHRGVASYVFQAAMEFGSCITAG